MSPSTVALLSINQEQLGLNREYLARKIERNYQSILTGNNQNNSLLGYKCTHRIEIVKKEKGYKVIYLGRDHDRSLY